MAFPFLALAGMAAQGIGQQNAAASTIEGARAQAATEGQNRVFQKEVWDADMKRQKPYYETGLRNLPQLIAASRYQNDPMNTGAARAQYGFGQNALANQGLTDPETLAYLRGNVSSAENNAGYNRLLDLEKIGLGASGAAGSGAQNYADAMSSSFMTGGNAMAAGTQNANAIRQRAYGTFADQASSIPAYMSQQRYIKRKGTPQNSEYGPYRDTYRGL